MCAFLIGVTIIFGAERQTFTAWSREQYAEPVCMKRAHEVADNINAITKAKIPSALLRMEISCSKLETRKT